MTPDYRAERIERLRRLASDRPAHLRYLDELVRIYEAGQGDEVSPDEEIASRVSGRVAAALEDDVAAAYSNSSGFGNYEEARVAGARAAAARQRTQQSLESLLRLRRRK